MRRLAKTAAELTWVLGACNPFKEASSNKTYAKVVCKGQVEQADLERVSMTLCWIRREFLEYKKIYRTKDNNLSITSENPRQKYLARNRHKSKLLSR